MEGRSECNGGSAPSASCNSLLQASDECSLDMTVVSMDHTLTSLRASALTSNSEDVLIATEQGDHCTPQDPSLGRPIIPAQGSENQGCRNGLEPGPVHALVRQDFGTIGSAQLDVFNNRTEQGTLGQTEVAENFFSLSDQSKESEDPNAALSTD
ncbi:hypothetical protein NDU88_002658 [Pleurodeles waltl]|uniref:Uncharacterized protein n=1 Tax=Pleurodeles waltl TaxID=8319 RepID=A0AAV7LGH4_PLEWA|nr:hypothetical protein NDU88_002658 [Pleurodeles waltl]